MRLRKGVAVACAPIACSVFVVLYIIAMSEDSSYEMFEDYISDLGVGPGAWAFNTGVVVSGLLLSVFASAGALTHFADNNPMRVGSALLAISGLFLAGVGIFTEDAGDAHLLVSYAFFVTAFISFAILAAARRLAVRSPRDPFLVVNSAAFAVGVAAVVLFGPGPLSETIAVITLVVWGFTVTTILSLKLRCGARGETN